MYWSRITVSLRKRIAASLWFRSVEDALGTIAGYEVMNMIRKGQVRWLAKGDVVAQVRFIVGHWKSLPYAPFSCVAWRSVRRSYLRQRRRFRRIARFARQRNQADVNGEPGVSRRFEQ